jgi:DNA-binding response OmpR family regulator
MKKRIIILEDDLYIRELLELFLQEEQFEVQSFSRARDFLRAVASINVDLFLLDVMLPDGNGIEICKELKRSDISAEIPVILMSANYNGLNPCPAEDFIRKPFDIDDLSKRVRKQLGMF